MNLNGKKKLKEKIGSERRYCTSDPQREAILDLRGSTELNELSNRLLIAFEQQDMIKECALLIRLN